MSSAPIAERIFGTRSRVRVLSVLYRADVPLNTSQIARRTGLSQPAVSTVVSEFADIGLVRTASAGRANVHWLVRDNIYAEQLVKPLFEFESASSDMLEEELKAMLMGVAESVVLFGSHARGDASAQSDVDVVIVAKGAESKRRVEKLLSDKSDGFARRWGQPLSTIVYDVKEAAALSGRAPAFYGSLLEEGVRLFGPLPFEWKAIWGSEGQ